MITNTKGLSQFWLLEHLAVAARCSMHMVSTPKPPIALPQPSLPKPPCYLAAATAATILS